MDQVVATELFADDGVVVHIAVHSRKDTTEQVMSTQRLIQRSSCGLVISTAQHRKGMEGRGMRGLTISPRETFSWLRAEARRRHLWQVCLQEHLKALPQTMEVLSPWTAAALSRKLTGVNGTQFAEHSMNLSICLSSVNDPSLWVMGNSNDCPSHYIERRRWIVNKSTDGIESSLHVKAETEAHVYKKRLNMNKLSVK